MWKLRIRRRVPTAAGATYQPERKTTLTDTEQTIDIDRKTKAHRSGSIWAIQKLRTNGEWDLEATFSGGGRAALRWCEENHVTPSREAEALLSAVPEAGF